MRKKLFSIPIWCLHIPASISIIGIIFGTFYDLSISKAIADSSNGFAGFFETIGESISYWITALGGILCFLGLFPRDKVYWKILGIVLGLSTLIGATYYLGSHMVDNGKRYGLVFEKGLAYGISACIMIFYSVLAIVFLDHHNLDNTLKLGLIILFVSLLQISVMTLLKKVGGRPRYRFLVDPTLNVNGDTFRAWYQFQPFKHKGDYYKSWPSGHVATATTTMLLACLSPLFRFKFKGSNYVTYFSCLAYTLLIAYTRIRIGAHYLSDVSFGLLVSTICMTLMLVLFRKRPLVIEE